MLNRRFRGEFVRGEMERDISARLTALEEKVMHSLHEGGLVTDNTDREFERSLTLGERVADKVAQFGGSWRFIIMFFAVMTGWIILNSLLLLKDPFDPYPYILLEEAGRCRCSPWCAGAGDPDEPEPAGRPRPPARRKTTIRSI